MEPQQQQPVQVAFAQFKCGQCQTVMQVKFPTPTVVNQFDFSQITFVHERLAKCPKCGMQYMFAIQGIDSNMQLAIGWKPVAPPQESQIVPGTNENYLLTVTNADIANKLKTGEV